MRDNDWGYLLVIILLPIWLMGVRIPSPPISQFPYEANVVFSDNSNSTITYFSDYSQDNNIVNLSQYTRWSIHWFDFKTYNIHQNLQIQLLDNDNKFVYTDRETGVEYNKLQQIPNVNSATQ
jgi:hypothetical protein